MAELLHCTAAALAHLRRVISEDAHGQAFRLSVKNKGCSGLRYHPEIVAQPCDGDIVLTAEDVVIYIDAACTDLIEGMTLDLVKKNLGQCQLIFNNPRANNTCGCGESFNVSGQNEEA